MEHFEIGKTYKVRVTRVHPKDTDPAHRVGDVIEAVYLGDVDEGTYTPTADEDERATFRRDTFGEDSTRFVVTVASAYWARGVGTYCDLERVADAPAPSTYAKDTNPKDLAATADARLDLSCIPWGAMPDIPDDYEGQWILTEIALAMAEGAWKYGAFNYRKDGVRASVYLSAFERHMMGHACEETHDADSNLPHAIKAFTCVLVLRDATLSGLLNDDRPPHYPGKLETFDDEPLDGAALARNRMRAWFEQGGGDTELVECMDALLDLARETVEYPDSADGEPSPSDLATYLKDYGREGKRELAKRMREQGFHEPKARILAADMVVAFRAGDDIARGDAVRLGRPLPIVRR